MIELALKKLSLEMGQIDYNQMSDCFSAISSICRIYLLLLTKYTSFSTKFICRTVFENYKAAILIDLLNGMKYLQKRKTIATVF